MRIYNLSKKASEDFLDKILAFQETNQIDRNSRKVTKLKDLRIAELDDLTLAVIFDKSLKLYFGRKNGQIYFPLLIDGLLLPELPKATVDLGAVKYVCNGANVMRPGVVSLSGHFEKGALIVVHETSHSKAIAIGRALQTDEEMQKMTHGPVIENYHYVGDKFWEALKLL